MRHMYPTHTPVPLQHFSINTPVLLSHLLPSRLPPLVSKMFEYRCCVFARVGNTSSRWVNFLEELFGNKFSLLLWAGAVLCFVGFSLQQVRLETLYKLTKHMLYIYTNMCMNRVHQLGKSPIVPALRLPGDLTLFFSRIFRNHGRNPTLFGGSVFFFSEKYMITDLNDSGNSPRVIFVSSPELMEIWARKTDVWMVGGHSRLHFWGIRPGNSAENATIDATGHSAKT